MASGFFSALRPAYAVFETSTNSDPGVRRQRRRRRRRRIRRRRGWTNDT